MAIDRRILVAALYYVRDSKRREREYYDAQDNSPYAPMYCIHGAYQWVEHDIPCGTCELAGRNYVDHYGYALNAARESLGNVDKLVSIAGALADLGLPEVCETLWDRADARNIIPWSATRRRIRPNLKGC